MKNVSLLLNDSISYNNNSNCCKTIILNKSIKPNVVNNHNSIENSIYSIKKSSYSNISITHTINANSNIKNSNDKNNKVYMSKYTNLPTLIFLYTIITITQLFSSTAQLELKYTLAFSTAGNSSPKHINYFNEDIILEKWAAPQQLTVYGALEQFKIGQLIRQILVSKYNTLPKLFDTKRINFFSIDKTINQASMKILSTALYPSMTGQSINETDVISTLPNVEIPNIDKDLDILLFDSLPKRGSSIPIMTLPEGDLKWNAHNSTICKGRKAIIEKNNHSKFSNSTLDKFSDKWFSQLAVPLDITKGNNFTNFSSVVEFCDTIYSSCLDHRKFQIFQNSFNITELKESCNSILEHYYYNINLDSQDKEIDDKYIIVRAQTYYIIKHMIKKMDLIVKKIAKGEDDSEIKDDDMQYSISIDSNSTDTNVNNNYNNNNKNKELTITHNQKHSSSFKHRNHEDNSIYDLYSIEKITFAGIMKFLNITIQAKYFLPYENSLLYFELHLKPDAAHPPTDIDYLVSVIWNNRQIKLIYYNEFKEKLKAGMMQETELLSFCGVINDEASLLSAYCSLLTLIALFVGIYLVWCILNCSFSSMLDIIVGLFKKTVKMIKNLFSSSNNDDSDVVYIETSDYESKTSNKKKNNDKDDEEKGEEEEEEEEEEDEEEEEESCDSDSKSKKLDETSGNINSNKHRMNDGDNKEIKSDDKSKDDKDYDKNKINMNKDIALQENKDDKNNKDSILNVESKDNKDLSNRIENSNKDDKIGTIDKILSEKKILQDSRIEIIDKSSNYNKNMQSDKGNDNESIKAKEISINANNNNLSDISNLRSKNNNTGNVENIIDNNNNGMFDLLQNNNEHHIAESHTKDIINININSNIINENNNNVKNASQIIIEEDKNKNLDNNNQASSNILLNKTETKVKVKELIIKKEDLEKYQNINNENEDESTEVVYDKNENGEITKIVKKKVIKKIIVGGEYGVNNANQEIEEIKNKLLKENPDANILIKQVDSDDNHKQ